VWTDGRAEHGAVLQRADEAQRVRRLPNTVTAAVDGEDQLGVGEPVGEPERERTASLCGIGRAPGRTDRRSDASGFGEARNGEGREREHEG
jgi:hypothetical protein